MTGVCKTDCETHGFVHMRMQNPRHSLWQDHFAVVSELLHCPSQGGDNVTEPANLNAKDIFGH